MVDDEVMRIADAATAGVRPSRNDIMHLLEFDAYSPEAAYVCSRAREVGMRACAGRGYVFAQIGVDANPCPEGCLFCSFSAVHNSAASGDPAELEVPVERIVHYAKLFADEGVDLVSLMATAGFDLNRYLDLVKAVRASVPAHVKVMANAGDLSLDQARALKRAGADAAYHALRLGEGEITGIQPAVRRRTMAHIREAGIELMTGVEPLWQGANRRELSDRICEIPDFDPFCMGACGYTPVSAGAMGARQPASTGFIRYVAAITRLVCGESVPIGGIGGVAWVDAGCDPRERGYGASDEILREKVALARRRLERDCFTTGSADGADGAAGAGKGR